MYVNTNFWIYFECICVILVHIKPHNIKPTSFYLNEEKKKQFYFNQNVSWNLRYKPLDTKNWIKAFFNIIFIFFITFVSSYVVHISYFMHVFYLFIFHSHLHFSIYIF